MILNFTINSTVDDIGKMVKATVILRTMNNTINFIYIANKDYSFLVPSGNRNLKAKRYGMMSAVSITGVYFEFDTCS